MKPYPIHFLWPLIFLWGCGPESDDLFYQKAHIVGESRRVAEGDGRVEIRYELSSPREEDTVLTISTEDGTAVSGHDYTAIAQHRVLLAAGEMEKTLYITIDDDELDEDDEHFLLNIKAQGSSTLDGKFQVVIEDDDRPPQLVIQREFVVGEGEGQVIIPYTLSKASGREARFLWTTQDHDAIGGEDYQSHSGQWARIPPGQTQGSLAISIHDDLWDEENRETFRLAITDYSGIEGREAAPPSIHIVDDDAPPTLQIQDTTVSESRAMAIVHYRLSGPSGKQISFDWSTRDGQALAGSDYTGSHGREILLVGSVQGAMEIPILNDSQSEATENFAVTVSNPSHIEQGGSDLEAQVSIEDDDRLPIIQLQDITVSESGQWATVNYTVAPSIPRRINFSWFTRPGTAHARSDYGPVSTSGSIAPGASGGYLRVRLVNDSLSEGNEYFQVLIDQSSLSASLVDKISGRYSATVTIADDEGQDGTGPTLSLSNVTASEGSNFVDVPYTLSSPASAATSFYFFTRNDSAIAGQDYTPISNRFVRIAPNTTRGNLRVQFIDDNNTENIEKFKVLVRDNSLSGISGSGQNLESIITIEDNDDGPQQLSRFITDDFVQTTPSTGGTAIDFLWVIDNSGSMDDDQRNLASNFSKFLENFTFLADDIDFKTAIVATGGDIPGDGRPTPDNGHRDRSGGVLNAEDLQRDKDSFIANFKNRIQVGNDGHWDEKGLRYSAKFLSENTSWARSNAYLMVIFVSDQDDTSQSIPNPNGRDGGEVGGDRFCFEDTEDWLNFVREDKSDDSLVKVFSITAKNKNEGDSIGSRYIDASTATGGKTESIKNDFSGILSNFGVFVGQLAGTSAFVLSERPVESTMEVYLNGASTPISSSHWEYHASSNALKFTVDTTPPEGTAISVKYQVANQ